jgi:hypothetical protein
MPSVTTPKPPAHLSPAAAIFCRQVVATTTSNPNTCGCPHCCASRPIAERWQAKPWLHMAASPISIGSARLTPGPKSQ